MVYIVFGTHECDDNYYPDYEFVIGVYSTHDKAQEAADKYDAMHRLSDLEMYNGYYIKNYPIDPEEVSE